MLECVQRARCARQLGCSGGQVRHIFACTELQVYMNSSELARLQNQIQNGSRFFPQQRYTEILFF